MCVSFRGRLLYVTLIPPPTMNSKLWGRSQGVCLGVGSLWAYRIWCHDITESQVKCGQGHYTEMSQPGSGNGDLLKCLLAQDVTGVVLMGAIIKV